MRTYPSISTVQTTATHSINQFSSPSTISIIRLNVIHIPLWIELWESSRPSSWVFRQRKLIPIIIIWINSHCLHTDPVNNVYDSTRRNILTDGIFLYLWDVFQLQPPWALVVGGKTLWLYPYAPSVLHIPISPGFCAQRPTKVSWIYVKKICYVS